MTLHPCRRKLRIMGNFQYLSVFIVVSICTCEGMKHEGKHVSSSETLSKKYLNHKWMKKIEDNKLLSAISIPGTHQSNKGLKTSTPMFQAWGLHNQLDAGIRFFELHVSSDSIKPGSVQESETLSYVLKTLLTFLGKQTKETVLLRVTPDEGAVDQVTTYLSKDKYAVWRDKEIPTMGQVRGKIVLIQSSTLQLGLPVHITDLDADMDTKEKQMRQNIKLASEKCDHEMMLTYTGAKGENEDPLKIAKTLNKQVDDYLLDLKGDTNRPHCVGIIAMDFPGPKVIQTIIHFNGKLGEGSKVIGDSNEDVALPDSVNSEKTESQSKKHTAEESQSKQHTAEESQSKQHTAEESQSKKHTAEESQSKQHTAEESRSKQHTAEESQSKEHTAEESQSKQHTAEESQSKEHTAEESQSKQHTAEESQSKEHTAEESQSKKHTAEESQSKQHTAEESQSKQHTAEESQSKEHTAEESQSKQHTAEESQSKQHTAEESQSKKHTAEESQSKEHTAEESQSKQHTAEESQSKEHTAEESQSKEHTAEESQSKEHTAEESQSKQHTAEESRSKQHTAEESQSKQHTAEESRSKQHTAEESQSKEHTAEESQSKEHTAEESQSKEHTAEDAKHSSSEDESHSLHDEHLATTIKKKYKKVKCHKVHARPQPSPLL